MNVIDSSFGVIPFKKEGGDFKYLMIRHLKGNHWSFPKGHKEPGETDKEAALRELREETGISDVTLLEAKPIIETYSFAKEGIRVKKTVTYFLGAVRNKKLIPQKEEIKELKWVSYKEALNLATFEETKSLIKKAEAFVVQCI